VVQTSLGLRCSGSACTRVVAQPCKEAPQAGSLTGNQSCACLPKVGVLLCAQSTGCCCDAAWWQLCQREQRTLAPVGLSHMHVCGS
jgi:hypothetical protein